MEGIPNRSNEQQNTEEVHKVEITVNSERHHVFPGAYIVSTFKEIIGVPESDILEESHDEHFKPLNEDEKIEVEGGEVFRAVLREHKVEVTVDNKKHHVFPGPYVVSTFKEIVKVPAAKVLEEAVNGELKLLDDSQTITIKGAEVFISHVRTGGSSK
jgi:hypothetical protein